ncbi:MAG TPA: M12 family metallopeptidase [Thermoanaerobaculia bacterium]
MSDRVCTPKMLPPHLLIPAARAAVKINPVNNARLDRLSMVIPGFQPTLERIAVVITKYWGPKGVRLTVGFLDNPPADLRARLLLHMNAWGKSANVQFVETATDPQVRVARTKGDGYWSYVGTDITQIQADQPTMNLDSFTMKVPESEFHRVVRHETGHTLGAPHEHMRRELVERIDPEKAIEYFGRTQGWNPDTVRQQVLTPIEEVSLLHTAHADPDSIMCYQIPGEITVDGQPILGGTDIDPMDYEFMSSIYPKPDAGPDAISVPDGQWTNQLGPFELSFDGTLRIAFSGRA